MGIRNRFWYVLYTSCSCVGGWLLLQTKRHKGNLERGISQCCWISCYVRVHKEIDWCPIWVEPAPSNNTELAQTPIIVLSSNPGKSKLNPRRASKPRCSTPTAWRIFWFRRKQWQQSSVKNAASLRHHRGPAMRSIPIAERSPKAYFTCHLK